MAGLLTPVPGGVGPMTIASLLRNTVKAARYQSGALAFPPGRRYISAQLQQDGGRTRGPSLFL